MEHLLNRLCKLSVDAPVYYILWLVFWRDVNLSEWLTFDTVGKAINLGQTFPDKVCLSFYAATRLGGWQRVSAIQLKYSRPTEW